MYRVSLTGEHIYRAAVYDMSLRNTASFVAYLRIVSSLVSKYDSVSHRTASIFIRGYKLYSLYQLLQIIKTNYCETPELSYIWISV